MLNKAFEGTVVNRTFHPKIFPYPGKIPDLNFDLETLFFWGARYFGTSHLGGKLIVNGHTRKIPFERNKLVGK